ncbi:MAG: hypothetical protein FJ306_12165 [Planctomycetes bacterium]|nr:hypothetical protein [Planctomycetota bacterium]
MNLYDLVKRRDRWLDGPNGLAAIEARLPTGTRRGVRFPAAGALRIRAAHAARCLADFPTDVG